MAQKVSITIFIDHTPKNQTFLKMACKKVNKSKRPCKDWASCAILSQSTVYQPISYIGKIDKTLLHHQNQLSLWVKIKNQSTKKYFTHLFSPFLWTQNQKNVFLALQSAQNQNLSPLCFLKVLKVDFQSVLRINFRVQEVPIFLGVQFPKTAPKTANFYCKIGCFGKFRSPTVPFMGCHKLPKIEVLGIFMRHKQRRFWKSKLSEMANFAIMGKINKWMAFRTVSVILK